MNTKSMCELIAKAEILSKDGKLMLAEEIFNYSPTGGLAAIWGWFVEAIPHLYFTDRLDNKDRALIREFFKDAEGKTE